MTKRGLLFATGLALWALSPPVATGHESHPETKRLPHWLLVEIPALECSLAQIRSEVGAGAATGLAALIPDQDWGLRLDAPLWLGFSWFPHQSFIVGTVKDSTAAEAELYHLLSPVSVPYQKEGLRIFPGETMTGALAGRKLILATAADSLPQLVYAIPESRPASSCEASGSGIQALTPVAILHINLDSARHHLAPLLRLIEAIEIGNAPEEGPLTRQHWAVAHLLHSVPSTFAELQLNFYAATGSFYLIESISASQVLERPSLPEPTWGESWARLTGDWTWISQMSQVLPSLGVAMGWGHSKVARLARSLEAVPGEATAGAIDLRIDPKFGVAGWRLTVEPDQLKPERACLALAEMDFCVRSGRHPRVEFTLSERLMTEWLAFLRRDTSRVRHRFPSHGG